MSWWKSIISGLKKIVVEVIVPVVVSWASEKLSSFFGQNPPLETEKWEQGKTEDLSSEKIRERSEQIAEYQDKIQSSANAMEQDAISVFQKLFDMSNFGHIKEIDINPIVKEVQKRSNIFNNLIRDYVNEKVSLSDNSEFKEISENTVLDFNTYSNKLKEYSIKVLDDAKKKVFNQLKKSVTETNLYIDEYVDRQLQSLSNKDKEMKRKLENLSSNKESSDKELLRTGEILASIALIESTVKDS